MNVRAVGTIASGSTTLTRATAAAFANGDVLTIAGAGLNGDGKDLTATIVSGAGTTTVSLDTPAGTAATGRPVTNAIWDDFHFTQTRSNSAATRINFLSAATLGVEAGAGKMRYAINASGITSGLVLTGCGTSSTNPIYDPNRAATVLGGSPALRWPSSTQGEKGVGTLLPSFAPGEFPLVRVGSGLTCQGRERT